MRRDRPHGVPAEEGHRERIFDDVSRASGRGRESIVLFAAAVGIFVFVAAFSLRQVTAPATATVLLEDGVATITEAGPVLAGGLPAMQRAAEDGQIEFIAIPGYPIEVYFTPAEITGASAAELERLLVERSAAIVYFEGLPAFDRTGKQDLGWVSSERALDLALGQLTGSTHNRANQVATAAGLLAVAGAVLVLLLAEGLAGFRRLGLAAAIACTAGAAFSFAAWWLAGRLGGSDAFASDLRALLRAALAVPLRNYTIAAAAGFTVAFAGLALEVAERRARAGEVGEERT